MKDAFTRLEDYVFWAITTVVTALAGAVVYLVRLIFTNQAQIDLMRQNLEHAAKLRSEDREALAEVRDSVKRIEDVLMEDRGHG